MTIDTYRNVRDKLPEIAADYVEHLFERGNAKRARDYTDLFLYYELQRSHIVEGVLDGDMNNIFSPDVSKATREQYNKLNLNITGLLGEAMKRLPIYEDVAKEYSTLEFLRDQINRDDRGRFVDSTVRGWYQNSHGELYHYDGVVWDEVPNDKTDNLEFLG